VFIAAEDNLEMVLKPRLVAAGARCELITTIKGARGPKGGLDDLLLEQHYDQIAQHITSQRAGFVYIDCLVDILADHDGHGYTQTRRAMRFLPRLAEETGAVVLATRHMTKAGGVDAWKRSIGSVGYTSRSRVTLQVYQDREDVGRRVLACALHRMGESPASLAFRLEGGDKSRGISAHVEWIGEDHRTADQLAEEDARTDREAPAKDRAKTWLAQRLAAGPAERDDLFAEAEAAGLRRSTVYNAADELNVIKETERPATFGGGWRSRWRLPKRPDRDPYPPSGPSKVSVDACMLSDCPATPDHSSTPSLDEWRKPNGKTHGEPCPACGNEDGIRDPAGVLACPKCDPIGYVGAFRARKPAA
jgi:hypothetical protein